MGEVFPLRKSTLSGDCFCNIATLYMRETGVEINMMGKISDTALHQNELNHILCNFTKGKVSAPLQQQAKLISCG